MRGSEAVGTVEVGKKSPRVFEARELKNFKNL